MASFHAPLAVSLLGLSNLLLAERLRLLRRPLLRIGLILTRWAYRNLTLDLDSVLTVWCSGASTVRLRPLPPAVLLSIAKCRVVMRLVSVGVAVISWTGCKVFTALALIPFPRIEI